MHTNIRLNLINNVASIAYHGHYNKLELLWLIGMLSDVTISDDMFITELEKVKKEFPEFIEMLTFKEK